MNQNAWLRCEIKEGMFSDEVAVVLRLKNGNRFSAFVPRNKVTGEVDHIGQVNVEVFVEGPVTWAILPTDYSDSVSVNDSELVAS